jgi:hypothetical protein
MRDKKIVPSYYPSMENGDEGFPDMGFCQECQRRILANYYNDVPEGETAMQGTTNIIKRTVLFFCLQEGSIIQEAIVSLIGAVGWEMAKFSDLAAISELLGRAETDDQAIIIVEGAVFISSVVKQKVKERQVKNVLIIIGNEGSHNNQNSAHAVHQEAKYLKAASLCLPMDKNSFLRAVAAIEKNWQFDGKVAMPRPTAVAAAIEEQPKPEPEYFILFKKALILCSDTAVHPTLQSLLEDLGFVCQVLGNAGALDNVGSDNSFVFIFAPDANNQKVWSWIRGHQPKHRVIIIGLKSGGNINNSNDVSAAKDLYKRLGCRKFIVFPFQKDAVQVLLQARPDESVLEVVQPQPTALPVPSLVPVEQESREDIPDEPAQMTAEDVLEEELAETDTAAEETQPAVQDFVSLPAHSEEEAVPLKAEKLTAVESTPSNPVEAEESLAPAGNGEVTIVRISVQPNGDVTISCSPELILFVRGALQKLGTAFNGGDVAAVSPLPAPHKNGNGQHHRHSPTNKDDRKMCIPTASAISSDVIILARQIVSACEIEFPLREAINHISSKIRYRVLVTAFAQIAANDPRHYVRSVCHHLGKTNPSQIINMSGYFTRAKQERGFNPAQRQSYEKYLLGVEIPSMSLTELMEAVDNILREG